MKKIFFSAILSFCMFSLAGQEVTALELSKKTISAVRIDKAPSIDGDISEEAWDRATSIGTDFITLDPVFGNKATYPTKVKVLYDNTGIYISAMMYDGQPDSIRHQLVERDGIGSADWFGVFIDPYKDGINGLEFIVTAAGVQFDAKATPRGEDEAWDAVWNSAVNIVDNGWIAEMKIPYSALRFPNKEEQLWHINFGRKIDRSQEKVFWSEVNPRIDGFLNQSGLITGIEGIKSPVRLSATPFVAFYGLHSKDEDGNNNFGRSFNGGMDIKYGINDAFTLDMTLIPDFGEARSDQEVLNLSPFEVKYDENRQFFTEGTELFSKGRLFYSRRIGGRPMHYWEVEENLKDGEEIITNPSETQLINATKLSGRTTGGLGVGWFNATAAKQTATIKDAEGASHDIETSPLSNYNVLVLDQNLRNNSSLSFINTSVLRRGGEYDANVSGVVFDLINKSRTYGVEGKMVMSQKYFGDSTALGYAYNFEIKKISGNWNWELSHGVESDTYDPNDLGFLGNNNERAVRAELEYGIYEPKGPFNRMRFGLSSRVNYLYNPNTFSGWGLNLWAWGQTKNFWNMNVWTFFEPVNSYDYFEPRAEARFYKVPTSENVGVNINTDRRKRLRFHMNGRFSNVNEEDRYSYRVSIGPSFRVSNNFTFGVSTRNEFSKGQVGFVNHIFEDDFDEIPDVIFGRRDRTTITNTVFASYNFNNKMALSFNLYHYWSKVKYNSFHLLTEEGNLANSDYEDQHNFAFDAFNIDLQYRWRFAPGSDIFIVWKNAISQSGEMIDIDYFDNLGSLFGGPQSNQISIKAIYYLDYLYLTKKA
jgi:hypothetical protein